MNVSPNYDYWQKHGSYWVDEYRHRQRRQPGYGLEELALTTILEANAPARVLEFGCGVGRHLSYVSKIPGVEVHGVDQSPTMIAGIAQWVVDPIAIGRAHLIEPTGHMPFTDGSFDIVYTTEVLLHVAPADIASRLAELVRVTRYAAIHFEPPVDYTLFAGAHNGCWNHDLIELYAALGITARRIGRPIEAHELVIAEIEPAYRLAVPGQVFFQHMRDVESWLNAGRAETAAASSPSDPPATEQGGAESLARSQDEIMAYQARVAMLELERANVLAELEKRERYHADALAGVEHRVKEAVAMEASLRGKVAALIGEVAKARDTASRAEAVNAQMRRALAQADGRARLAATENAEIREEVTALRGQLQAARAVGSRLAAAFRSG